MAVPPEVWIPSAGAAVATALTSVGAWAAARATKTPNRTEQALTVLSEVMETVQQERDRAVAALHAVQADIARERERVSVELTSIRNELDDARRHFAECDAALRSLRVDFARLAERQDRR